MNPISVRTLSLFLAIGLLLGTRLTATAADPAYEIVDLGAVNVPGSEAILGGATGINESGVVVGYFAVKPDRTSPFIVRHGKVRKIKSGQLGATFTAINNAGVIVGREVTAFDQNNQPTGLPAFWVKEKQSLLELPVDQFGQAATGGVARAINDDGVIVGDANFPDAVAAAVWRDGVPTLLPNPFGASNCSARDVNQQGLIAGQCFSPAAGDLQPVIWQDDLPSAIDAMGWPYSTLAGVGDENDGHVVLGGGVNSSADDGGTVRWSDGEPELLPGLPDLTFCAPFGVSPIGVIFGTCIVPPFVSIDVARAVMWIDGEIVDANTLLPAGSGWILNRVQGMNGDGWIVGLGQLDGERHAFLLRPLED
jgi:hypothetical protein